MRSSFGENIFLVFGFLGCDVLEYCIFYLYLICRTIFAVYSMVGTPADMSKAEQLFLKLDQNSDGSISQEEFVNIIKKDHDLLNVLQNTA